MKSDAKELVSVLMCVYNTPVKYLKDSVESILNQTYNNIEFVIVDDGSSDHKVTEYLENICKEDGRIKLLHNPANLGLTRSLNIGLEHCNGMYVARMDSDDISLPERIRKQVTYMDNNTSVALVGSGIILFGEIERDKVVVENLYDDYEIYRINSLFRHSGPPHPTFMFRRAFICENNIKYREEILKAQDYGIIIDILKAGGRIDKTKEPLVKYRIHDGQITKSSLVEQVVYQWRVSYDYIEYLFPKLLNIECMLIAMLGCSCGVDEFLALIDSEKYAFDATCELILDNSKVLRDSRCYIKTIKKIIRINEEKKVFDEVKFEHVIRHYWWKKAVRESLMRKVPWGIYLYTLSCCRFRRM